MNEAARLPRPSKTTLCPECSGTGREVVTEDVVDEAGEVTGETSSDFGPCEICEGQGWHPRETAAQLRERQTQEVADLQAHRRQEVINHRAKCQGRSCPAPRRFHPAA